MRFLRSFHIRLQFAVTLALSLYGKSVILGVWAAPEAPGDPSKRWGGFAPNLLQGSPGPKMTDLRSLKCFLNMLAIQSAAT